MERYKQKSDEDTIPYLLRLAEIKIEEKPDDLDWSDIAEYCNFNCHYDSLRKAMQPKGYGGFEIYKYLKDKFISENVSDDKVLNNLEITQREIYKERQKLRDEKNEYNNLLREQSRLELFFERIDEAIDKLTIKKPRNIPQPINNVNNETNIICSFADCHYGVNFDIRGFNNEILNKYNPEIFMERMWKLRDELLNFCNINNCKNVSIIDLGDSIEGILHLSQLKIS